MDLAFIKTANTPNNKVEVHVASAASNYQTFTAHAPTAFTAETDGTDGTWQLLDNMDLAFIKTVNTPNNKVEVHVASWASNYQVFTVHAPTAFTAETDGTWQLLGNNDLAFIKTCQES